MAPAGLVSAHFAGGILSLAGDGASNDVSINFIGVDSIAIVGNVGTMIALNGGMAAATALIDGTLKALATDFGSGNDRLALNTVTIAGPFTFEGGDGNDTLELSTVSMDGALTVHGGADDDVVNLAGAILHVGGAATLDLGEGTNTLLMSSTSCDIGEKFIVVGGAGVDTVSIGGTAFAANQGFAAQLGGGSNSFALTGQNVRVNGSLDITHLDHVGLVITNLSLTGQLIVTGGVNLHYGAGNSLTFLFASLGLTIGGTLKLVSAGTDDSFNMGAATALIKGGIKLDMGDGANGIGIAGLAMMTPSISYIGGAGADALMLSPTDSHIGSVTVLAGAGTNLVTLGGSEMQVSGMVKVVGGPGDDSLAVNSTDSRLGKGVQFLAGDGVNSFGAMGTSFQSGTLFIQYGEHAAGTSAVNLISNNSLITGPILVTGKGGMENVLFGGSTFLAKGISLHLGDGANSIAISGSSAQTSALQIVTGTGADTISLTSMASHIKSLSVSLGAGANAVNATGNSLVVQGPAKFTTGGGDDMIILQPLSQEYGGALQFTLGEGADSLLVSAQSVQVGGGLSIAAGLHGPGVNFYTISGVTLNVKGPLSASFAGGDHNLTVNCAGTSQLGAVKLTGGSGADALTVAGTGLVTGAISFKGGEGANTLIYAVTGGALGTALYTGGSGTDTFSLSNQSGRVGAVTANLGSGNAFIDFSGGGEAIFTGPVTVQTASQTGQFGNLSIASVIFAGSTTFQLGNAADSLSVSNSIFGSALMLSMGGGNDTVGIETVSGVIPTIFRNSVSISMGAGADTLAIGANTVTGHAEFQGAVKFDGGADADVAHVSTANFANLYIPGQPTLTGFETHD